MTTFRARLLVAACAAVFAACGVDTATLDATPSPRGERAGPLAAEPLSLRYEPTDAEREAVRAAARAAFPTATVTVSRPRGTLASLTGTAWATGACPPSRSAHALVLEALAARPEVFRLAAEEWSALGSTLCSQLEPGGTWLTLTRHRAGLEPVGDQALHVLARRTSPGGVLLIEAVAGAWLPPLPGLEAALHEARAAAAPEEKLRLAVEKASFPYTTFERCVLQGGGVYKAKEADAVSFDKPRWLLRDDASGVTAWLAQPGRLELAPEHVTSDLVASDAWCPPVAGFALSFDALQGELVGQHPGLGCVVCLAP